MQRVDIYQMDYSVKSIYKVQKAVHQLGLYDNTRTGRYSDCFVYVLKGTITYMFSDYQFTVHEGDLAYLPKDGRYMMRVSEEDAFIFVDFEFDCDLPRKGFGLKYHRGKDNFDKLWITWQKAMRSYVTECRSILYKIYADVIDLFDKTEQISGTLRRKMEKSVEEMICVYTDPDLSVARIIENTQLSPTQYRMLFVQMFHMSPKQYILKLRLDYAKELLSHTTNSVAYIATACGFKDEFYFSAIFKKKCGHSPSEYRKFYLETRE